MDNDDQINASSITSQAKTFHVDIIIIMTTKKASRKFHSK